MSPPLLLLPVAPDELAALVELVALQPGWRGLLVGCFLSEPVRGKFYTHYIVRPPVFNTQFFKQLELASWQHVYRLRCVSVCRLSVCLSFCLPVHVCVCGICVFVHVCMHVCECVCMRALTCVPGSAICMTFCTLPFGPVWKVKLGIRYCTWVGVLGGCWAWDCCNFKKIWRHKWSFSKSRLLSTNATTNAFLFNEKIFIDLYETYLFS